MASVIDNVKQSIVSMSDAQKEALEKSEEFQKKILAVETVDQLNVLIKPIQELAKYLKDPLNKLIGEKAKQHAWLWKKEAGQFMAPPPPPKPVETDPGMKKTIPGSSVTDEVTKKELVPEELPFA